MDNFNREFMAGFISEIKKVAKKMKNDYKEEYQKKDTKKKKDNPGYKHQKSAMPEGYKNMRGYKDRPGYKSMEGYIDRSEEGYKKRKLDYDDYVETDAQKVLQDRHKKGKYKD